MNPASVGTSALLELRGVGKRFGGVVAVNGLDLTVEAGEVRGLIGPNGSGKTTTINLVSALYRPDGGEIRSADRSGRPGLIPTVHADHLAADEPARVRGERGHQVRDLVGPAVAVQRPQRGDLGEAQVRIASLGPESPSQSHNGNPQFAGQLTAGGDCWHVLSLTNYSG